MKVKIDSKFYIQFDKITLSKKLNALASTFSFAAYLDPENAGHKSLAIPLSYNKVEIYDEDDTLLLTGMVLNHAMSSRAAPDLFGLSGYSKTGILEDCCVPTKSYPLEHSGKTLASIAKSMASTLGISVIIDGSVSKESGLSYKKSTLEPDTTVGQYLSNLCSQRNVLVTHNEKGDLILMRPNDKSAPILSLDNGSCTEIGMNVNGQDMHSELTVIRQPSKKSKAALLKDIVKNPLVKTYRPAVRKLNNGEDSDTANSVKSFMSNELNAIELDIRLDRYEKVDVGKVIEVRDDRIFLKKPTKFIIKEFEYQQDSSTFVTTMKCVLPETFSGATPKNIWE